MRSRPGSSTGSSSQIGDPAWDLAGALQDLLLFWVQSMPTVAGARRSNQMMAAATLSARRGPGGVPRALGRLPGDGRADRPGRADLLDSGGRFLGGSADPVGLRDVARLDGPATRRPVILLQVGANILDDPELAQVQLYGLHGGAIL